VVYVLFRAAGSVLERLNGMPLTVPFTQITVSHPEPLGVFDGGAQSMSTAQRGVSRGFHRLAFLPAGLSCFVVTVGLAEDAAVDWLNGNQLFQACEENDRLCMGYVIGVTAAAQFSSGSSVCIPSATVTTTQVTDVVKLWLGDHPETRHKAASFLVLEALRESFPAPNYSECAASQHMDR
jgi:Rap1a immunity proteins